MGGGAECREPWGTPSNPTRRRNGFEHLVHCPENLAVGEPDDPKAVPAEYPVPFRVIPLSTLVDRSVRFHNDDYRPRGSRSPR